MSRVTSGSNTTTLKSIQLEVLRKLPIILPPIKEQQKITSILKKVDELIQKTDQIIGQTQKLKKGLMQRLLTKGIGHNKFKKTSVGEIPEDWITENIGTYVNILSGEYFPYNEFSNEGIPVLKIDNVMYGNVDWTNKTYLPKNYLASPKHLVLNEDDIVLALNRPITNNKVKVAIVRRKDTPSILYQRVGKLEFSQNQNLDRKFFFIYLTSPFFKKHYQNLLWVLINHM
jgi:type I restriction enzyme, S subunit